MDGAIDKGEDFRAVAWTRQLYADVLNFDLLDAKSLVSTDQPTPQVALQLAKNVGSFTKAVKGLMDGDPDTGISALQHQVNRDTATDLLKTVTGLKGSIDSIVKNMEGLAQAKQAARDVSKGTQEMLGRMALLTNHYRESGTGWGGIVTGVLFTMFTLFGLALIAKVLLDDVRVRALKNEKENRRNERAILRLLDDMSELAEGNLTKHAQVTEDMTGAIADSVNYAIDELRSLVAQINSAASQLTQLIHPGQSRFGSPPAGCRKAVSSDRGGYLVGLADDVHAWMPSRTTLRSAQRWQSNRLQPQAKAGARCRTRFRA